MGNGSTQNNADCVSKKNPIQNSRKYRSSFPGVTLAISIGLFFAVISQIDSRFQVVYFLVLLGLPVYMAFKKPSAIQLKGYFLAFILSMIVLSLVCCVGYMISGEDGYFTGYLMLMLKAFLMYTIGYMASSFMNQGKGIAAFIIAFVVGALIYAFWLYFNYFPGLGVWLSNQTYLFPSKNSFGQIAGASAICCFVYFFWGKRRIRVLITGLCGIFLMGLALLLQCRTSILAFFASMILLLVLLKKKHIFILLFAAFILIIALTPSVQNFVMHAFLFDKYQSADLNTMSSGRIGAWLIALEAISQHPLLGYGDYYVDCLYLNTLANIGLFGFLAVMIVWVGRVVANLKRPVSKQAKFGNPMPLIVACMTVFYLVESVLEGQPPFGPGVCSALFWVLCGLSDGFPFSGEFWGREAE